ncbi:glycerol-3-phosphate dehydrogenase/oxidase [Cohnella sp. AR92]|uniref:glycerol-3-phosphate dehydrogenase/oxidase n=1 Tax=Cohnella sp. AR92 TaxID=648716 RepID=UPI000F8D614A|nr:FAD-dependent oxidoreductase [Cohnella sp. AR92]RUS47411.1 glycerol-3-phosphate dehydrogenase/oxidase [Cohnella sp. AR92]
MGRHEILKEMSRRTVDLLVIGGGITGAGIALDAASRGLRVALVEMQDFAAGTSSRSTKLVHGGLRYLKQLEIGVVAEVGKERAIVYENGPHVTTPEWMLLPLYAGGTFGKLSTSVGLRIYDLLAGVKRSERRSMLSAQETLRREPLLKKNGLKGGGYYVEYRTDDARLTIEVIKKAVEYGALAINYARVTSLTYDNEGRLRGAAVRDEIDGGSYEVTAAKVVNATGPWVDELRRLDGSKTGKTLRLTKGVHLVFDKARFPLRQAVYFDTPDGRMVFAIPRAGKAYFGTTDTNYAGAIDRPTATQEDRAYLLNAANFMFPDLRLTESDIESSWAGLRPLIQQEGKDPSEISRRDEIFHSPSGLISIAGGKLTGYRKMAESVVDDVVKRLAAEGARNGAAGGCRTKELRISGGDVGGSENFERFVKERTAEGIKRGYSAKDAEEIARFYGSNANALYEFAADPEKAAWADRHGLPLRIAAELWYAMDEEMAVRPQDFLIRRTGWLFFDIASVRQWSRPIIGAMAERAGWTDDRRGLYAEEMERLAREASEAI